MTSKLLFAAVVATGSFLAGLSNAQASQAEEAARADLFVDGDTRLMREFSTNGVLPVDATVTVTSDLDIYHFDDRTVLTAPHVENPSQEPTTPSFKFVYRF